MLQLLTAIKFQSNRSRWMSMGLINTFEISFLALLITSIFKPFYFNWFGIIVGTQSTNFIILTFVLAFTTIITLINLLSTTKSLSFLKNVWLPTSQFLNIFTYVLFIPLLSYCISAVFDNSGGSFASRIVAGLNCGLLLFLAIVHELLNWSFKFRVEDYCNRRINSLSNIILVAIGVALNHVSSFYASIIYLLRAILFLHKLYSNYEFQLIQKLHIFYSLLTFYLTSIVLILNFNLVDNSITNSFSAATFLIICGAAVSLMLTNNLIIYINHNILRKSMTNNAQKSEEEAAFQREGTAIAQMENELKMFVEILLEREKMLANESNVFKNYWKLFNQRIFMHRIKCENIKCVCKSKRKSKKQNREETDLQIYIHDLVANLRTASLAHVKESHLKVMNIYLYIEIALKPLKGFYELMSLQRQSNTLITRMEIQNLTMKARECFDQIFYKNKVQNQQLELMKVIQYEETLTTLIEEIKIAISQTINFLEIFTYNNVKISNVEVESKKLFSLKQNIQEKISNVIEQTTDNNQLNLIIYLFYRFLEVYRSKELEFKKIASQQLMKKRIYQKSEVNLYSEDSGIIYIDLIQQRGKIKKITKSISNFFGYLKQDMISFNINLFMPRLYGRNHARFLSNFIDKGRIKLLKQKNRIVFGKNKKKFIFPVNVRLKTEHLQENQFGASAFLTSVETSSQFLMGSNYGRVQQISEFLFKRLFSRSIKDEVGKINRLCLYKMILSLNQYIDNVSENHSNKIYEGLLVYSDKEDYLFQKFKFGKDATTSTNSIQTKSLTISNTMSNQSHKSGGQVNKSQRHEYLTELFKNFIVDLNIFKLKGLRISYKYSKIKTSEFEVDLIEIVTIKQEVSGKQFYKELLIQLSNVAEIYDINEEHSPLTRHLQELNELIQESKYESYGSLKKAIKEQPQSKFELEMIKQKEDGGRTLEANNKFATQQSVRERLSNDSFVEDDYQNEEQNRAALNNQQNSEQSSLIGNSENESKKQILINAFNSKDNVVSTNSLLCSNTFISFFVIILMLSTVFTYQYTSSIKSLWEDNVYILDYTEAMQFRVALSEMQTYYNLTKLPMPAFILSKQKDLNLKLKDLIQNIRSATYNTTNDEDLYAYNITLYDPIKQMNFTETIPQVLNRLFWMDQLNNDLSRIILRQNYQTLHSQFKAFYSIKNNFLKGQNSIGLTLITIFLSTYESILLIIGLCCLPIYIYFKKKQLSVRSLLAYMNIKEVKKSIIKLKLLSQYIKLHLHDKKSSLMELQDILSPQDKRDENQSQIQSANKTLKITTDNNGDNIFKNPWMYTLLLLFIIFFSNLSLAYLFISTSQNNFLNLSIQANKMSRDLQIKPAILINLYFSNINRVLENQNIKIFHNATYAEIESGYFDLQNTLSEQSYQSNSIAQFINQGFSTQICGQIRCNFSSPSNNSVMNQKNGSTLNLGFMIMELKNRWNYWAPENNQTITNSSIHQWYAENHIEQSLLWVSSILELSFAINSNVTTQFTANQQKIQLIIIILSAVLIPINILVLILLQLKFLKLLNIILRSAEHIFMHFHVSVLIQNTYLTSYFNSKVKQNK